jgi:hypothetical protein
MKAQWLIASVFLLISVTITACKKTRTLEFIIPTSFSGILKLRADSPTGVELVASNETISLVFPASGTLDVTGRLPILDWHRPIARFADGTRISIPGPAATVQDETIALRRLGVRNNKEAWYLVGKLDQMQDAINKFYGFEVPRRQ